MKLNFKLKRELVRLEVMDRGVIREICEHTGLERHQVSAMLRNKVTYLSLDSLGKICAYLIEAHGVSMKELPGILFELEVGEFLERIAERSRVEICSGLRSEENSSDHQWVPASDASLTHALMHELFGVGGAFSQTPKALEQRLVSSADDRSHADLALPEAQSVYAQVNRPGPNRCLLCLGSIKSNVLVELVVAQIFGCVPFVSQDEVEEPKDRGCPVFLRYRPSDVKPLSCHGGLQLARSTAAKQPGIYYETADGSWECCQVSDQQDAALVISAYCPNTDKLDLVMGGFSGRATTELSRHLKELCPRFWPPNYQRKDLEVGVHIVRFDLKEYPQKGASARGKSALKVIPLEPEVLKRRLDAVR